MNFFNNIIYELDVFLLLTIFFWYSLNFDLYFYKIFFTIFTMKYLFLRHIYSCWTFLPSFLFLEKKKFLNPKVFEIHNNLNLKVPCLHFINKFFLYLLKQKLKEYIPISFKMCCMFFHVWWTTLWLEEKLQYLFWH